MKKIITFLFILLSIIVLADESNYYYKQEGTVLIGTIERDKIKDPPGYHKGAVIYPYYLLLDIPIQVNKDESIAEKNRYVVLDTEIDVNKIHLIFDSTKFDLVKLKGKQVIIKGKLYHKNSRYHYTDVVMEIESIEKI